MGPRMAVLSSGPPKDRLWVLRPSIVYLGRTQNLDAIRIKRDFTIDLSLKYVTSDLCDARGFGARSTSFGGADPAERQRLLLPDPLPIGTALNFLPHGVRRVGQDRLYLSRPDAVMFQRVWGIEDSVRIEVQSSNTTTPASAQVALRLPWYDANDAEYRSFSVRTTSFSAPYTPRYVNGDTARIRYFAVIFSGCVPSRPNKSACKSCQI